MKMKALTLVLIGALGLSWMAQAELVTPQSKSTIQASLKALHGSNLDVSVFDQLMTTHLQDVAAGKVHGNQSILDIELVQLEDLSINDRLLALRKYSILQATPASAQQLNLPQLVLVKKTVNGKLIDSITNDSFGSLATKVSDTADSAKLLQGWHQDPTKRQAATPEVIAEYNTKIEKTLNRVWLKSVEQWDSLVTNGRWEPEYYSDFVALVNNALATNQSPSVESFRQLLDASIVIARTQNLPDSDIGKKAYQMSLWKISEALATYLALTLTPEQANNQKVSIVLLKFGEKSFAIPALNGIPHNSMKTPTLKAPALFVGLLMTEHEQWVEDYYLLKNKNKIWASIEARNKEIEKAKIELAQEKTELAQVKDRVEKVTTELAQEKTELAQEKTELAKNESELAKNESELAKNESELAKNESELAKNESELAFITEANQVQQELYSTLQEYLKTQDVSKLDNIRHLYGQLQDLNQRAKTEYSNDEVKQRLLALAKMCETELKDKLNPVIAQ